MKIAGLSKWWPLGFAMAVSSCGATSETTERSSPAADPTTSLQASTDAPNVPDPCSVDQDGLAGNQGACSGADSGAATGTPAAGAGTYAPDSGAGVSAPEASAGVSAPDSGAGVSKPDAGAAVAPDSGHPSSGAPQAPSVPDAGSQVASATGRPSGNTGQGFYVSNGKIYDANGVEFRIRGVNAVHWWAGTGEQQIPSIANAHANTARAVFGPGAGASTPELRQSIVEQYIAAGVVPMVDYHNATCDTDPALVSAAVDLWVGPDKAWLQKLERNVMINITNEWGPDSTVWRDAYVSAVTRLRQAGVNNLLVIDAGGDCGQNADSIETWAKDIVAADPQKNVVFSIHMYGFWHDPGSSDIGKWDGRQPYDIDLELKRLLATGLPIIVGEFSTEAFSDVGYTSRTALSTYEKDGVGWLAWDWNNPADGRSNIANTNVYNSSADLTTFGQLVVEDPTLGLKANAHKATTF